MFHFTVFNQSINTITEIQHSFLTIQTLYNRVHYELFGFNRSITGFQFIDKRLINHAYTTDHGHTSHVITCNAVAQYSIISPQNFHHYIKHIATYTQVMTYSVPHTHKCTHKLHDHCVTFHSEGIASQ